MTDIVTDHRELRRSLLAQQVAVVVTKHYPGHRWAIGFPPAGGGMIIRSLDLPTEYHPFIQERHIDPPHFRRVLKEIGEFLERFNLRRGRFVLDDVEELVESSPKRGALILPDLAGTPRGNVRDEHKRLT